LLDRWAFGMSKIDGTGATAGSASAASNGPDSLTSPPSEARESSVDGMAQLHALEGAPRIPEEEAEGDVGGLKAVERITVKIADLSNGEGLFSHVSVLA
jgi:hypothetical protein